MIMDWWLRSGLALKLKNSNYTDESAMCSNERTLVSAIKMQNCKYYTKYISFGLICTDEQKP
jgi:hypothetical protein